MKSWIVKRSFLALSLVLASTIVVACEDKRIKELDTGIGRDSVLQILGASGATSADTLPNIYKRSRYLMGGKEYEVLYFTSKSFRPGKDSIPLKETTPVVLVENKLIGRGWGFWDSVSVANKLPPQKR
jgi:hypothetical protein